MYERNWRVKNVLDILSDDRTRTERGAATEVFVPQNGLD